MKPKYIIPFRITKDYCINQFAAKIEKDIYAPAELKDAEKNSHFRGIYMPYWLYDFEQKGRLKIDTSTNVAGSKVHKHETTHGNLVAEYKGISHDASSTFPDSISERIGPYTTIGRGKSNSYVTKFYPSYLCGFYADAVDIGPDNYKSYASEYCKDITVTLLKNSMETNETKVTTPESSFFSSIKSTCTATDLCMFPVWFLAFKRHNRVAYAAVNGQSGKLISDIPISIRRFAINTALLALPIFLLLFAIPSLYRFMLFASVLLVLLTTYLYNIDLKRLLDKDMMVDDIGLRMRENSTLVKVFKHNSRREGRVKKINYSNNVALIPIIFYSFIYLVMIVFYELLSFSEGNNPMMISLLIYSIMIFEVILTVLCFMKAHKFQKGNKRFGFIIGAITVIGAGFSILSHRSDDSNFAVSTIFCCIGIAFMIVDIVSNHNYFSTLPRPRFHKKLYK